MTNNRKARVELGIFELAYGIRACDHLAEAYSHMNPDNPAVDAAHKQMVTILNQMSKKFSEKLSKLKQDK
jgi:hypothetical protein